MTQLSIVIVQLVLAVALQAQGSKPPAGTEALQGTWVITSINGQPMPAEAPEMTLTFAGDAYHQAIGGKVAERGTTRVDASTKPIAIDLLIAEGGDAGKIQLGIIEVIGDEVRASFDTPNTKQRPTDLNPREGAITIVGKRAATPQAQGSKPSAQMQGFKPPAGTEALQGTWVITSINGQPMPAEAPEMTLTFAGDAYHQAIGGKVAERGTTRVDASKKPIAIDLLIAEGDDAGKTQLGIIEVTGDEIRGSLDLPDTKQRPTDLNPKEGAITIAGKRAATVQAQGPTPPAQAQGSKPRAGAEALQGTWVITSINGQPMPAEAPEMTLTIAGDAYHQAIGGKVAERGTTKVDASKKPIEIDLLIGEGDDAGKIQLGIIEVIGDEIRASLDIPNTKQRPTDLNPKEGAITIVGKRKKG